jgi:hypothetical protein
MTGPILRKYGVAATITFELYETDGTDLKTDAVHVAGDTKIMKDEGAEANTTNGFVDEGQGYSIVLTIAEMTAARVVLYIVDQSTKVWLDRVLHIETYGHASAQHAFDLDTATQGVNLTQIGGVAQSATDLKDFADAGYDPATDQITGVKLTDLVTACTTVTTTTTNTDLTAFAANYTAARAAFLDELAAANLPADVAANLAAIAALNDLDADAVWDEVMDTNAPANANSARELINVIVSALAGKLSGSPGVNRVFRDLGDTKDRLTVVVDADYNRTAATPDGT